MALVIEDGTIVANANSYVTDAEYVAYAAARGKTIGLDAAAREIELILANDYLEGQEFKGWRVEPDNQELAWPRSNVLANGRFIDSGTIPKELKNAQIEAAIAANTLELQINSLSGNVQKERLGEMEVSYFSHGNAEKIRLDRVNNYLKHLLLTDSDSLVRV